MTQRIADDLLKLYFEQNKNLFKHLFGSYNEFVSKIIPYTLTEPSSCYFYESIENN